MVYEVFSDSLNYCTEDLDQAEVLAYQEFFNCPSNRVSVREIETGRILVELPIKE